MEKSIKDLLRTFKTCLGTLNTSSDRQWGGQHSVAVKASAS